jgi:hypothetical protein
MRFLDAMHPGWNISLFHYRNQGADYGRILVGLQVPAATIARVAAFLETLAYPCVEETPTRSTGCSCVSQAREHALHCRRHGHQPPVPR